MCVSWNTCVQQQQKEEQQKRAQAIRQRLNSHSLNPSDKINKKKKTNYKKDKFNINHINIEQLLSENSSRSRLFYSFKSNI